MGSEDPSLTYLYLLTYAAHKEAAYTRLMTEVAFLAILAFPIGFKVVAWLDLRFIVGIWTIYIKMNLLLF
jgi:hypothetical protein